MLKNIKSSYIVGKIFPYLNGIRKLYLAQYNKNLQNKFGISLKNYKLYSGKYIIYESEKKGRICNLFNDDLLYEGEFLNRKKNGKAKEYEYKRLIFEGEYLNGKKNGKCKEYYFCNGKIKFEGEYLNGKKWNGKGYNPNGNLTYELKDGKGYIKEYFGYGSFVLEGEYLNGEKNGKAKEYSGNNIIFEGEYLNDKKNGKAKEYDLYGNLVFEGEYLNGRKWNGKAYGKNGKLYELKEVKGFFKEYVYKFGSLYEGKFLNGKINGKGKEYDISCDDQLPPIIFEGEYSDGKKTEGKEYKYSYIDYIISDCQEKFEGKYLYGKKWKGIKTYSRTEIIKEYLEGKTKIYSYNNEKKGKLKYEEDIFGRKRKEYDDNGNLIFEGEYINGRRSGIGKEFDILGDLIFEGEYINGKRNGNGKEYKNGNLIFEGEYKNGKRINGKEYLEDILFEDEFLNGKKNKKVKGFNNSGKKNGKK